MIPRPPCPNSKCPLFNIHPKPYLYDAYTMYIIHTPPYFRSPLGHTFTTNSHAPPAPPTPPQRSNSTTLHWSISIYVYIHRVYHHTPGISPSNYTLGITPYIIYRVSPYTGYITLPPFPGISVIYHHTLGISLFTGGNITPPPYF